MNDKFLYITNNLNDQYPPADIAEDIAWIEMQKLLDDNDDTVLPPVPPNQKGYWKYGLLLFFILIASIAIYIDSNKTQPIPSAKHEQNNTEQKVNEQNKNIAPSLEKNSSSKKDNSYIPVDTLTADLQTNKTITSEQLFDKIKQPTNKNNSALVSEGLSAKNNNHTIHSHTNIKNSGGGIDENKLNSSTAEITARNKHANKPKVIFSTKSKKPKAIKNIEENISENATDIADQKNDRPLYFTTTPTVNPDTLLDSSTIKNRDSLTNQLANLKNPEKNKTDTALVPNEKKNKKIALTVGLGLNQFFTVSGQQHSDYNSNGTVGAISDYIPVPFVRAYLNRKVYLQIEAQFNTPQYTKQLLANTETIYDSTGPMRLTNQNIYINKLFYFNIPLSIHYSPFNNFYFGAGIQFSQLKNCIGLFETQFYNSSGTDSIAKIKYASLNNSDSAQNAVYRQIKTHEWRFLLDANYQWNNLVVGLRYNQALSNFINVQISTTEVTQATNSSLQLYLRYILWKNRPAKALLLK